MDVKSAFLNGELEEEVYVDQPAVCLYVDDLIFTSNSSDMINKFREDMVKEFEMTDLGLMPYFLVIEVQQTERGIFINQQRYADRILKRFKMDNCNPILTPVQERLKLKKYGSGELVNPTDYKCPLGCLRYLTAKRPDIRYAVGLVSRFMESPRQSHLQAAKCILKYVKGTTSMGILYTVSEEPKLVGYTDSDWAGDTEGRKSTPGYAFHLGTRFFSWSSKKQQVVALSTTEAEYIVVGNCATQAVWLRMMLKYLFHEQVTPTTIICDNNSSISLTKNPVLHGRSKHIDIKYYYIRELVSNKEIAVEFCESENQ
ncbi:uncharacterized protein LOC113295966 [Papaver somniferum]|uniref:uncharacterized protein LOC113295966 n=1 Tax=Papaver somniferum TaxID=3469 RepID=UPI000E7041F8|nr:uncharacterized protein LOC113295966 [Papaver somniferum]